MKSPLKISLSLLLSKIGKWEREMFYGYNGNYEHITYILRLNKTYTLSQNHFREIISIFVVTWQCGGERRGYNAIFLDSLSHIYFCHDDTYNRANYTHQTVLGWEQKSTLNETSTNFIQTWYTRNWVVFLHKNWRIMG